MSHPPGKRPPTVAEPVPAPSSARLSSRQWLLLAAFGLAQLMLVLDVTVVNVALPDIARSLDFSQAATPWVVTAYILMLGGFMLLGGRVADLVGPRRMVIVGLAAFVLTSLIAGFAWDPISLLVARSAQGLSAAFLSPAALAAITVGFTGPARHRALGLWGAIGGVGASVGVLLGGLLTSGPGWRWIFFINVPIGLASLMIIVAMMPRGSRAADAAGPAGQRTPIGIGGGITVTGAMAAIILALTTAADGGWFSPLPVIELVVALALFALFLLIERHSSRPLINVTLLKDRRVATGSLIMLVCSGLLIGLFFLLSFDFQQQLGWSALNTGLAFLPMALGTLVGAHLAGHAVSTRGPRVVGSIALAVTAVGLGVAAWQSDATALVIAGIGIAASGLGAGFVTGTSTALGAVDHVHAGLVAGIVNTCHEFGGAVGISILSGVVAAGAAGNANANHGADLGADLGFVLGVMATTAAAFALVSAVAIPRGTPSPGAPRFMH